MRAEEASPKIQLADRYHLCFALGKALEDRAEYAESFALLRARQCAEEDRMPLPPRAARAQRPAAGSPCARAEFFAARQGHGSADSARPIFIVGLPRSGSTLIEQILASHSQVEGTMELADIPRLVQDLQGRETSAVDAALPGVLAELERRAVQAARGEISRGHAASTAPAKLVLHRQDAEQLPASRAHPSDSAERQDHRCAPRAARLLLLNFKQLFASGQQFTYSVEDIARYYRMYVELMAHWDAALPGRVLRVQHETVVDDLEGNVRRILDFCGLDFEPACVDFHKTERTVHSASSEQVRQPIYREGVDQWRHFEPWLGPLKVRARPVGRAGRLGSPHVCAAALNDSATRVEMEVRRLRGLLEKGQFPAALPMRKPCSRKCRKIATCCTSLR